MKKFTVLLLYPDYLATQYGEETYLSHVMADDVTAAVKHARKDAFWVNRPDATDGTDFKVLFVAKGHVNNLFAGEEG